MRNDELQTLAPHLSVKDAPRAIRFYATAFGAAELFRNTLPDGRVAHAELLVGDSRFYVNEDFHGSDPPPSGRSRIVLHLYVDDVDNVFARALAAGAVERMEVADQPWGDRYGELIDPFGHTWSVATRLEDLSPNEIRRRMQGEEK